MTRDEDNMECLVSVGGILVCHTMESDFHPVTDLMTKVTR